MEESPTQDKATDVPPEIDHLMTVWRNLVQARKEETQGASRQRVDDCLATTNAALQSVIATSQRRRRILALIQEALAALRLDMKYLAFDLEATRRERDEFRRQLEAEK
jgi:hypothetical protein